MKSTSLQCLHIFGIASRLTSPINRYKTNAAKPSTTTSCLGISTAATSPTARVERELSEFKDVGKQLHVVVDSAHKGERCELCSAILNWFVLGENPDGILLVFASKERVARKLQKFLDNLLAVTVKFASMDTRCCCSGQTVIPQAMHKFLVSPPTT